MAEEEEEERTKEEKINNKKRIEKIMSLGLNYKFISMIQKEKILWLHQSGQQSTLLKRVSGIQQILLRQASRRIYETILEGM